jgi:hypothetical protein
MLIGLLGATTPGVDVERLLLRFFERGRVVYDVTMRGSILEAEVTRRKLNGLGNFRITLVGKGPRGGHFERAY